MFVHYEIPYSLDKASNRYYSYCDLLYSKWKLFDKKIKAEKAVIIEKNVEFRLTDNAGIAIGEHSVLSSYTYILMTKPNPFLKLGKHVATERHNQIIVKKYIEIGDYTRIGAFVMIRDHTHAPYQNDEEKLIKTESIIEPVIIGKNVWIGSYSSIFPGAKIGDGAIVCSYSYVDSEVPPNTVVAGQPARVIKRRVE